MTRWKKHWRSQGDFYRLGVRSKTDKVSYHSDELMYHRNLSTNLSKEDCFLEIGFGCHMSYGPGASAQIWPELYPEAHIHLLELEEPCVRRLGKEFLEQQNYTVHIADQGKIMDLERVKDQVARSCLHGLFVVIDDGSHISTDMITSFHSLYPLLQRRDLFS